MDQLTHYRPDVQPISNSDNNDCLVDIVNRAENTRSSASENPELAAELDRHVLMDVKNDEVELMCQRCPVQCTAKRVGGKALLLVHNREECADL